MRHITQRGLDLIKRFEGFRAAPYLCPAGYWTIGYGAIRAVTGGRVTLHTPAVTEAQAQAMLARDLVTAERAVLRLISVPLTDGQFDALVSFTFNLGAGALQRSGLRRKVNREEHAEVPGEFLRWVWGGGRKLPGLIRRRAAEAVLYRV